MAADGWFCKTRQPMRDEVGLKVSNFRNRKCAWEIVVMAGCDAQCRFNMFSSMPAGSAHDAQPFDASSIGNMLEQGRLPRPYYLVGDEAFKLINP